MPKISTYFEDKPKLSALGVAFRVQTGKGGLKPLGTSGTILRKEDKDGKR